MGWSSKYHLEMEVKYINGYVTPIYKPRIQVMGWSPRTKITHQDSAFIFLFHRLITFALLILSSGLFFLDKLQNGVCG